MTGRFVVQITAPHGSTLCRLHLRRRHLVAIVLAALLAVSGLAVRHAALARGAAAAAAQQQTERAAEQRRLDAMARQAQALQALDLESRRSIERIERTLGGAAHLAAPARHAAPSGRHRTVAPGSGAADSALNLRLGTLARQTAQTRAQAGRLAHLVRRVLVLRRLSAITRERMIAAIPSLNPVNGVINAAFGWRTNPWPEFHRGLDLAADYGTPVRAAAAGTVAAAGWEGGYGNKIDIDHGNGYHTWYCHLSRMDVSVGEAVGRGQTIAAAGSTGESTGPHLHYQVMRDGVAIDPRPYLNGVPPNVLASLSPKTGVQ